MVVEYGMSDLGPISLGPQYDVDEMGKTQWYEPGQISPAMQEKVDNEIRKLVEVAYKNAASVVKSHRKEIDAVVSKLIEKETLDKEQFEEVVGKKGK